MSKYKIRMHKARIETKYGVDTATVFDDPESPKYNNDEVLKKLMYQLSYEPDESESSEYPGFWDGDVGAYFDYDGFEDIEIPDSIIKRVLDNAVAGSWFKKE